MTEPAPIPYTPAYKSWTPCEDRPDPAAWVGVHDEPYDGPFHDPAAEEAPDAE
jgi:hypothetical protein